MQLGKRSKALSVKEEPTAKIEFEVPMPPSVNALYVNRKGKGGQVALSETARKYREQVKQVVSKKIAQVSTVIKNHDGYGDEIYKMEITCYFPKLENPAWFYGKTFTRGEHEGDLKIKLRYKRVDIDNRIKFLQDWITKCVGLDDSSVFEVTARKVEADEEKVKVSICEIDREGYLPPRGNPEWLTEWRKRSD